MFVARDRVRALCFVGNFHKRLRAAMVVANVGALLLCARDAITSSPASNLLPCDGILLLT